MKTEEQPQANWEKWIVPKAVFGGIVLAFAFCCWSGHRSAQQGCYREFTRFHQRIIPESMFFPTVSQARQYVLQHIPREKILVLVGGSSVFQGTGQSIDELWSRKLQELLGDDYAVVNFAFRAGRVQEYGLAIAEGLAGIYPKMIFLVGPMGTHANPEPDGLLFRYFFWDVYYKGLLMSHPARDAVFGKLPDLAGNNPAWGLRSEIRRGAWLDSELYFNDLWNRLAYTTISTPWNIIAAGEKPFYAPRGSCPDQDGGALPLAVRYKGPDYEVQLRQIPAIANSGFRQDDGGDWHRDDAFWKQYQHSIDTAFPPALRPRTLAVAQRCSPHLVAQLSREERRNYERGVDNVIKRLENLGFRVTDSEIDFQPDDFADMVHLSGSGGAKLAAGVAPAIRKMAMDLNYLPVKK